MYRQITSDYEKYLCKSLSREEKLDVASSATPGIAKRKGRKVILRRDWEQIKDNVMTSPKTNSTDSSTNTQEKETIQAILNIQDIQKRTVTFSIAF